MRTVCLLIGSLVLALPVVAQDREADLKIAVARVQHLKRGINVSHWFSQNRRITPPVTRTQRLLPTTSRSSRSSASTMCA